MVLPILTATILLSYDTFMFDIDGVLKTGYHLIPNSADIANFLYRRNKTVLFISNNDWEDVAGRAKKFQTEYGITEARPEDIVIPSLVATYYFNNKKFLNKTVYMLAPPKAREYFKDKLQSKIIEENARTIPNGYNFDEFKRFIMQNKPDAVIMDSYNEYTNENLAKCINYLRNPEVEFYQLSGDEKWMGGHDLMMPDCGAFKKVVEVVTGRKATPLGKPSRALNEYLIQVRKINKRKALMFGDNLTTDVIMTNEIGIDSCFMLTGVHSLKDVEAARLANRQDLIPTYQGNFTTMVEELRALNYVIT